MGVEVKESVQINYRGGAHFFPGLTDLGLPTSKKNAPLSWIVPVMNATLIPTAARVKGAGGRRSGPKAKAKAKMESDGVTWLRRR